MKSSTGYSGGKEYERFNRFGPESEELKKERPPVDDTHVESDAKEGYTEFDFRIDRTNISGSNRRMTDHKKINYLLRVTHRENNFVSQLIMMPRHLLRIYNPTNPTK